VEAQQQGSAAARRIADFLLRHPARASAAGIEELATATRASPATLSRFARAVGASNYGELKGALAASLQEALQPVEKLKASFDRSGPEGVLAGEGIEAALSNMRAAADALTPALLANVVAQITASRCIYVMGFGLSAHVAGLLTLGLQPFRPLVVNVVDFGGSEVAAARLAAMDNQDLLIAISFPRYARDAVQLAGFARDRGARVLALTDSPASPLAPLADLLLPAPATHPVLSSSMSAAVLVAEAVVTATMASNQNNVRHAEALTQALETYLVGLNGKNA
jgi:DNA-binding MurR/RpiR family transcriptional regulator